MRFLAALWSNDLLWVSFFISVSAQFLKPLTHYLRTHVWDWRMMASTGGMPSSHSALVCALSIGIGLVEGFGSPLFAMSAVFASIVLYDAGGVRREAGEHARAINLIIAELLHGHPLEAIRYKEVLGHSYAEVLAGIVYGVVIMLIWKLVIAA